MRKGLLFAGFVIVAVVGLVGVILIAHFRPDATATLLNAVTTILTLVSGFGILVYQLVKVNDKVNNVEQQTNGRLSSRDERIKNLEHELIKRGVNPHEPTE